MYDLTPERNYDSQATRCIDVFSLFLFDISAMDACTASHWQTSGRLMQELNLCTVNIIECHNCQHKRVSTYASRSNRTLEPSLNVSNATRKFPVSSMTSPTIPLTKVSNFMKLISPTLPDESMTNTTSALDLHSRRRKLSPLFSMYSEMK